MTTTQFFEVTKDFNINKNYSVKKGAIVKYIGIQWGEYEDDMVGIRYDDVALEVEHLGNYGFHYMNLPKAILKPLHYDNDYLLGIWTDIVNDHADSLIIRESFNTWYKNHKAESTLLEILTK